jgi:hypothetical protein
LPEQLFHGLRFESLRFVPWRDILFVNEIFSASQAEQGPLRESSLEQEV